MTGAFRQFPVEGETPMTQELANIEIENPEEPPIRVMAVHALAYCERLFYLEEVEEIREADDRVYEGRTLHEERVPKTDDESRELRSFEVSSDELGLFGKVDAARVREGQWVVYEHKKGKCKRDKDKSPAAWPSDRMQVAAYAMLLETQLGRPVPEARIRYHQDNVTVTVTVDEVARAEVQSAIRRMRELRRMNVRPSVTDNEKLCRHCSLRVVCLPEEERLINRSDEKPARPTLFPARRDRRTLHITSVPASVRRSDRTLVIETQDTSNKVPIEQVDAILLYGAAQMTSQTVHLCAWEGIAVQWISGGGRVLGSLHTTIAGVRPHGGTGDSAA